MRKTGKVWIFDVFLLFYYQQVKNKKDPGRCLSADIGRLGLVFSFLGLDTAGGYGMIAKWLYKLLFSFLQHLEIFHGDVVQLCLLVIHF